MLVTRFNTLVTQRPQVGSCRVGDEAKGPSKIMRSGIDPKIPAERLFIGRMSSV